jgi:catechol 2,3-dioxygenase
VHLRTADIDRVRDFYVGVLGFNTWKSAGTHEAVYISDPDGNDLELYWDRPQSEWALDAHGHLAFAGGELDLEDLAGDPRSDL